MTGVAILLAAAAGPSIAAADALERLRPENLRAVHDAIHALQGQRQKVTFSSEYDDVRTALHVHSAMSHDSRGTLEEILTAANEAGVRVIMFSEHPSSAHDYFLDGHRGVQQGVLLIPGAETGGFLAYPRRSIQDQETSDPQAFADLVRSTGGLVFVSHLEERMDWEIDGVTGTEIYNTHADVKGEDGLLKALGSPLALVGLAGAFKQYPQEAFGALMDYPADYLRRYDQLCLEAPHTGVSANDAHHNQVFRLKVLADGQLLLEDALGSAIAKVDSADFAPLKLLTLGKQPGDVVFELDLDPYACSLRHVSTHLLLSEVTESQVWQALDAGRAYVAFDWLADPTGFVYRAERGEKTWPLGAEIPLADGLHLRAEAPLTGRMKLFRNGAQALDRPGRTLDFAVDQPGVYRVEVWLDIAGELRPWILTNPIYVRAAK